MKTLEKPEIFVCIRSDVKAGDYLMNNHSQYIWQAEPNDLDTVNTGVKNGSQNVSAIICKCCQKEKARHDYNGTHEFLCDKCYENKLI
jgi:hypothetical protein